MTKILYPAFYIATLAGVVLLPEPWAFWSFATWCFGALVRRDIQLSNAIERAENAEAILAAQSAPVAPVEKPASVEKWLTKIVAQYEADKLEAARDFQSVSTLDKAVALNAKLVGKVGAK